MRYPTRGYQCDPPSTLLLRRPQGIHVPMQQAKTNLVVDRESHISISTARLTVTATPSIFCCAPSATRLLPGVSLRKRSIRD
jgi:hypothetical protein